MVKKELSETEIAESIPDLWQPLTQEQREFLAQNFTIQKYKKNETIYCEGETPMHLMCLLSGKVKIYKEGVGGRSQIIRVLKTKEYFAYRAYFAEGNFVTALMRAAYGGYVGLVEDLLANGADKDLIDKEGHKAIHYVREDCLAQLKPILK